MQQTLIEKGIHGDIIKLNGYDVYERYCFECGHHIDEDCEAFADGEIDVEFCSAKCWCAYQNHGFHQNR